MRISGENVLFGRSDMRFVERFGIMNAAEMVLNFRQTHPYPFVYDTYQLAQVLGVEHKDMLYIFRNCNKMYREFELKKKNGRMRRVAEPQWDLKLIQRNIAGQFLSGMSISPYASAYRRGVGIYHNAVSHVGKKYLLKMDIVDFFGSISFEMIYSSVFHTGNFPRRIGVILTKLCCYNDVLAQGAPTSPMISNLVMRAFDNVIGKWCARQNISYTRYSDDLTFSGDVGLYHVYVRAKSMLEEMGFEVHEGKTHFLTAASRQSVTGLTVNDKVCVARAYKQKLRQECYYVFKYGVEDAIFRGNRSAYMTNGKADTASYLYYLLGCVRFVLQIEPTHQWFNEAKSKLQLLLEQ